VTVTGLSVVSWAQAWLKGNASETHIAMRDGLNRAVAGVSKTDM